jgi:hypothetical protein
MFTPEASTERDEEGSKKDASEENSPVYSLYFLYTALRIQFTGRIRLKRKGAKDFLTPGYKLVCITALVNKFSTFLISDKYTFGKKHHPNSTSMDWEYDRISTNMFVLQGNTYNVVDGQEWVKKR